MASIVPKIKMFLFISFVSFLFNMVAFVMSIAINNNTDMVLFVTQSATSFLPFFDLVPMAFLGLPFEVSLLFSLMIVILGTLKLVFLGEIILSHIPFIDI